MQDLDLTRDDFEIRAKEFVRRVAELEKTYEVILAHEDDQGGFLVTAPETGITSRIGSAEIRA